MVPLPSQKFGGTGLKVACLSRGGREPGFKKTNQDNCFAFEKYIQHHQSLFGTFDGHGPNGHLASSYVKHHLPLNLVTQLSNNEDVGVALTKGFLQVDAAMTKTPSVDCEFSGTTAVVSLLQGNTLTTGWVGDSRAVIGRGEGGGPMQAVALTSDHKPIDPGEKERILEANGRVER
ncbi:unnamed protein product [Ostreobium quekettii]|uniref:PPM-type phosphatase domain-containing protein n=1 Tax=Ostreobium quekettii TaxID=121088 RepID=A0A8S1ISC8_9CHLO|nr:unnamed protein product [Ostreobium quekettii]